MLLHQQQVFKYDFPVEQIKKEINYGSWKGGMCQSFCLCGSIGMLMRCRFILV